MSFLSSLTGEDAADASRRAAADTYQKQQSAISQLLGYGDDYAKYFQDTYAPYTANGRYYNDALRQLVENPSSVRALPGYQFDQDQGIQALDRSAAAKGMLNSGRASKDLMRFGTGLADKTYGDQLQRLMGLNQQGLSATAASTQGETGRLGTRTTAFGGQMNAAGTIGQGDVAAANAMASGSQNLLNFGGNLAGKFIGAGVNPFKGFNFGNNSSYANSGAQTFG